MSAMPPNEPIPRREDPFAPPGEVGYESQTNVSGDQTGGLIPYRNPAALIGYYLGVFSLIPCLGFFLAVPALVLGLVGLQAYSQNPAARGRVHAWVAVTLGAIFTLIWGAVWLIMLFGIAMGAQ